MVFVVSAFIALASITATAIASDPVFLVSVENQGRSSTCTGVIMNEYLIITSFYCVCEGGEICQALGGVTSPQNLMVYKAADYQKRSEKFEVKRVGSPDLNFPWVEEGKTAKGLAYLQLHKPIAHFKYYRPCEISEGTTPEQLDFAFVMMVDKVNAERVVFINSCSFTNGPQTSSESDTICSNDFEGHGAVMTSSYSWAPQCIIGVTYGRRQGYEAYTVRLDAWWDYIMQWFVQDGPFEWTPTQPIPLPPKKSRMPLD